MFSYRWMYTILCPCISALVFVSALSSLSWNLHMYHSGESSSTYACSEICHLAVTTDSFLHEKSNIRLHIVLTNITEADSAETDPAIFATVSSQSAFVGFLKCVCNYNPGAQLKITWEISQHIVFRHNFRTLMQCKHCTALQYSIFKKKGRLTFFSCLSSL